MTTTDKKIHGLPEPQLGYRLAFDGDTVCPGMRRWSHAREEWLATIVTEMDPGSFYAIPIDDGYTYYAPGETVIQAGDEYRGAMSKEWITVPRDLEGHEEVSFALRRPKAKPPTDCPHDLRYRKDGRCTHIGCNFVEPILECTCKVVPYPIGHGERLPTGHPIGLVFADPNCPVCAPLPVEKPEKRYYEFGSTSYLLTPAQAAAITALLEAMTANHYR